MQRGHEYQKICENLGSGQTSELVNVQNWPQRDNMLIQADYNTGVTGNVFADGRLSAEHDWVLIHTFTASAIKELASMPQVRIRTDTLTGGSLKKAGVLG